MKKIDLTKYGITGTTELVHNPSYEELFKEETKPGLEGYEKGQVSELGAVNVMTGIYTGRSPKDKFIVVDDNSKDTVWWTSDAYKNDMCATFQAAVVAEVQDRLKNAIKIFHADFPKATDLVVGGGVAANSALREMLEKVASQNKMNFYRFFHFYSIAKMAVRMLYSDHRLR